MIGTANTAILLTSSFLVAWAVEIFAAETRRLTAGLLAAAICLGLAFIALKGIEYHGEYEEHLVPGIDFRFTGDLANGVQLFFIFYFIATAIHALHMIIGIGLLAALALLCRGAPSTRHRAALHSAVGSASSRSVLTARVDTRAGTQGSQAALGPCCQRQRPRGRESQGTPAGGRHTFGNRGSISPE